MEESDIIEKMVGGDMSDPRARIAAAAICEFAARSLEGARTRQIAEKSGVNPAAISYYFGGKGGLYKTVISQTCAFFENSVAPYYARGTKIFAASDARGAMRLAKDFLIGCIKKFSELEFVPMVILILARETLSPSEYFKPAYTAFYGKPVEFIAKLLKTAAKRPLADDMAIVFAHSLWASVRTYSAGSDTVMKLHSWKKFGDEEFSILEKSLDKVLRKTLS